MEAAARLESPAERGTKRWLAPAVLALGTLASLAFARWAGAGASPIAVLAAGLAISLLLAVVIRLAQIAHERTHDVAGGRELPRQCAADESGRAGEEIGHREEAVVIV